MSAALGMLRKKILVLLCKCQDTKLNIKVGGVVAEGGNGESEPIGSSVFEISWIHRPRCLGFTHYPRRLPMHSLVPCPVCSRSKLSLEWLIIPDVSESMVRFCLCLLGLYVGKTPSVPTCST